MLGRGLALVMGLLLFAAAAPPEVQVTGPVYYGRAQGASDVGVVDIRLVYASNPAFVRMRAFNLSETDGGRGQKLFDEAQSAARHALAVVASAYDLDVITEIGGVTGTENEPADLTQPVIDELPQFYVEGKVLHGSVRTASSLGEIDSQALLGAIPAYVEWLGSDPSEARYHLLKQEYEKAFARAVRQAARNAGVDLVVEKGAATLRDGAVDDLTSEAIAGVAG